MGYSRSAPIRAARLQPYIILKALCLPKDITPDDNAYVTLNVGGTHCKKVNARDWSFKKNACSYYGSRVHFTPIWYPDDTQYPLPVYVMDAWTPGGELTATVSDSLQIYGSCLDDWYIHIKN